MTGGPDRLQAHLSVTVEAGGVRPIVGSVSTLSTPPEEMGQSLPLAPRPLFSTKDPPFLNADIYNPNLSPTSPCLCFLAFFFRSVQQCGGCSNKGGGCFRFLPVRIDREKTREKD
jgi:hypothetical protein